jgi:alkylated DNA nucleotide flippase Atl1
VIKNGQKYIDQIGDIKPGEWLTYGEVALWAGTPAGARAAGQAMLALNDMTVPTWRVFPQGGELPKIHGEPKWHASSSGSGLRRVCWKPRAGFAAPRPVGTGCEPLSTTKESDFPSPVPSSRNRTGGSAIARHQVSLRR